MNEETIKLLIEKVEQTNDLELNRLLKMLLKERQQLIADKNKYQEMSKIDSLTGLNNRRILSNITNCSSLAICDIDNFKSVNDTFGHDTGDKVIKGVADIIHQNIRDSDFVCRYGGDEFIIAFTNCFQEDIVKKRLDQIQKQIKQTLVLGNEKQPVTTSIGMVMNINNDKMNDIKDLIVKADMALYQSKEHGKSQVTQYHESPSAETGRQI